MSHGAMRRSSGWFWISLRMLGGMGSERDTPKLQAALDRLADCLGESEDRLRAVVPSVSGWSPAQHVEHTLIAVRRMFAAIVELRDRSGTAIKPKGRPTLAGRALLMGGWIPRGKAEAPDFAVPGAAPDRALLRENLEAAATQFAALVPDAPSLRDVPGVIDHPILESFSAAQWWRFARVHTEHHLAIIDDLLDAIE